MADTIVRLRVDSKEYDAQIKKAAEGLLHLEKSLRDEGKTLADVDKEQLKYIQAIGQMETKSTTAKGKVNELSNAYADLAVQYKNMSNEVKQSDPGKAMAANLEQLKVRAKEAQAQLKEVQTALVDAPVSKGMGVSLASGVKSALSSFGPQMMAIAGVTAAIGGMKSVLGDVVNINKQFEQSSANLAAVMGTTRDQISDLTQQAKQLGATTQYTAVQITELQTNLAKLGFTQQEILSSTKPIQALATATGSELGEAAVLAGAALRGFGLNASEMERVASVLAVSTTKSALSFEKLATALPTVQVAAAKTGFSIEDTVAMLGKLVDSGMNAASAATQLRKILNDSTTEGTKLANALGGPVKGFDDLVIKLDKASKAGMTHADSVSLVNQKNANALDILRDMATQYTINEGGIEKQTSALQEMRAAVTDCSDDLQKMQDERLNTLEGSVTILKSAWEGLMLTFGSSNGILKQTTDALARLLQAWTNWRNRNAGGDAAIGTYEKGLTAEDRQRLDAQIKEKQAAGATTESIIAGTEQRIAVLEKERNEMRELLREWEKAGKLGWGSQEVEALKPKVQATFGEMPKYAIDWAPIMQKRVAEYNDRLLQQNYVFGVLSTQPIKTEEEEDNDAKASEKLRTIEAQYKEQEMAQIAALDRQAMNEEEYEKKVYEIKRTWLQKIADLYEEGTEQRARANASISSLDIQFQASTLRRANQQAKAEEREAAKTKETPFLYGDAGMANMAAEIKKEMSTQIVGSEGYLINAEKLVDLNTFQNMLKSATAAGIQLDPALVVGAIDRIGLGIDIPDEEWNALVEEINKHLKSLNLDPIKLDISTGAVKTAEKEATALEFGWVKAAQAVEQVGSAIQSIEDPSAKIAGIIASAIANVAAGLGGILASQEAMANPWSWVALALSGTATMISTVSAIKSATAGSYALGGVIPGSHYSGDMELAAVNAGETILNVAQTGVVADALKNNPLENIHLEAIISGRDLRLVLANNDRFFGGSRGDYVVATSRS